MANYFRANDTFKNADSFRQKLRNYEIETGCTFHTNYKKENSDGSKDYYLRCSKKR